MIFCNGFYKCGTNLLMKICGAAGFKDSRFFIKGDPNTKVAVSRIEMAAHHTYGLKFRMAADMDDGYFCHSHIPYTTALEGHKVINIARDPRNTLVSACRQLAEEHLHKEDPEYIRKCMGELIGNQLDRTPSWPLKHFYFIPWEWASTTVRFENIFRVDTIQKILDYLGSDVDAAWLASNLYGSDNRIEGVPVTARMSTFTGKLSNWEDFWDDEIEDLWKKHHGYEVMKLMGYER